MRLDSLCGVDLATGRVGSLEVRVRGACRDEVDRIAEFYRSLSSETLYLRFMNVSRDLKPYLERVFDSGGAVVVAEAGDAIIGSAEVVPASGGLAEVGVVVHDDYQGMGIGRILTRALLKAARITGVRRAVAYILPGNFRALRLARKVGFRVEENMGDMIKLVLDLP